MAKTKSPIEDLHRCITKEEAHNLQAERNRRFAIFCKEEMQLPRSWSLNDPDGDWQDLCLAFIEKQVWYNKCGGGRHKKGVLRDYNIYSDVMYFAASLYAADDFDDVDLDEDDDLHQSKRPLKKKPKKAPKLLPDGNKLNKKNTRKFIQKKYGLEKASEVLTACRRTVDRFKAGDPEVLAIHYEWYSFEAAEILIFGKEGLKKTLKYYKDNPPFTDKALRLLRMHDTED